MKISLIGFMCSGKTSVGRILAERLGYKFAEIDELIIKKLGRVSMEEVFEKDGETKMRDIESSEIMSYQNQDNIVISIGGGAILREETRVSLKKNSGIVIYLETEFQTLKQRINSSKVKDRPLFKDLDFAEKLYKQRASLYQDNMNYKIQTDSLTIEQVVEKILQHIL